MKESIEITDKELELICQCIETRITFCDIEINNTLMWGNTEKDLDHWCMVSTQKKELVKLQKKLNEMKKQGE